MFKAQKYMVSFVKECKTIKKSCAEQTMHIKSIPMLNRDGGIQIKC